MRPRSLSILAALTVLAGLAACRTSPPQGHMAGHSFPQLDAASANAAGLSLTQVNEAVQLGNAKCIRCHKFYQPSAYSETDWRTWMRKMSRKARLNPAQESLLSKYLDALRQAELQSGTNTVHGISP